MVPPQEYGKSDDAVPDPELSPTTNPLLAQNLGLWAQVYYTTPPEQRDQAVQKLLEELKGESRAEETASEQTATPHVASGTEVKTIPEKEPKASDFTQQVDPAGEAGTEVKNWETPPAKTTPQELAPEPLDDSLVCPACLHKNRAQQRFCGLCGFPLKSSLPQSPEAATTKERPARPPAPPPAESFPRRQQIERSEESWDWLREKNSPGFDTSSEHSGTWKYIALVAGVLVLLLLASIWWAGSNGSRPLAQPAATEQSSPATSPVPAQTAPAAAPPSATSPSEPQPTAEKTPTVSSAGEASPTAPDSAASADEGGDDDGTAELIQARRYLEGNGVPRDALAASRWLWKSVAKQNTQAVLLLSDLYARGDGVSKSCDQARVLLKAAAERGSTEASAKLVSLRQSDCP